MLTNGQAIFTKGNDHEKAAGKDIYIFIINKRKFIVGLYSILFRYLITLLSIHSWSSTYKRHMSDTPSLKI